MTDNAPELDADIENLVVRYENATTVGPVSFQVPRGAQVTLLGPSGCGKSSTLRGIAGLEKPESGVIRIDGKVVFDSSRGISIPTEKRGLSMVFQSYAIWPHMTVFENVAYGLRVRGLSASAVKDGVERALALVDMSGYIDRPAAELSGGQQQRVALARACAFSPKIIFFDEPLSNLDAKLRARMRIELRDLQKKIGAASIYVTHDLEEALAMSDRIVILRAGKVEQVGTPDEIYNFPKNAFVADFVGSANLVTGPCEASRADGEITIRMKSGDLIHGISCGRPVGDTGTLAIRTGRLRITKEQVTDRPNSWKVEIVKKIFLGDVTEFEVLLADKIIRMKALGRQDENAGDVVYLNARPDDCILLEDNIPPEA